MPEHQEVTIRYTIREPDEATEFTVFDLTTGEVKWTGSCQLSMLYDQAQDEGLGVIEGKHPGKVIVNRNGRWRAIRKPVDPPTIDEVRREAARRIEAAYPMHRQLNTINGTDDEARAAMREAIDAVRAASNKLEHRNPIPADFAADCYWPAP